MEGLRQVGLFRDRSRYTLLTIFGPRSRYLFFLRSHHIMRNYYLNQG